MNSGIQYEKEAMEAITQYSKLKLKLDDIEDEMNNIKNQFKEWLKINNITEYPLMDETENWWNIQLCENVRSSYDIEILKQYLTPAQLESARVEKKLEPYIKITKITKRKASEIKNKFTIPTAI